MVRLKKAQSDYEYAINKSRNIKAAYDVMEKAFLDEQAGILACSLKEGEKCPVCGSTDHPALAVLKEGAPSEEELKDLKEKQAAAAEDAAKLSSEAGNIKGKADSQHDSITEQALGIIGGCGFDLIASKVKEALAYINEKQLAIRNHITETDIKILRKEVLDKFIPVCEENEKSCRNLIQSLTQDITRSGTELSGLDEQIIRLSGTLEFESKKAASQKIEEKKKVKTLSEKALDDAKLAFDDYGRIVSENKTKIDTLKKQLEGSDDIDLDAVLAKQNQLAAEKKELIGKKDIYSIRLNANKKAGDEIKKQNINMAEVEKRWTWVKALSNTANGNVAGKEKIMLETYIQMTYFDRIIARANTRLMTMTGGQYELIRRTEADDKKSRCGLELDVTDHYNGTERSVKTLSGGESFKASLSLALGLSDEIQSSAGGIKLDTMFVDEGFGSLDEDSIEQAIKALYSLTEGSRLVGIISHVSELKQKIDRQIVVTKEKTGGSRVNIIT
jgi:exonuclease SbcC